MPILVTDDDGIALESYETHALPAAFVRPMTGRVVLLRILGRGRYRISPVVEMPRRIDWAKWTHWIAIAR